MFRWAVHVLLLVAVLLVGFAAYRADGNFPSNPCEMSYMHSKYLPIEMPSDSYSKYRLLRFVNPDESKNMENLTPVLFIPGSAGAFQQARTLGSQVNSQNTVVYTIDFDAHASAVSGLVLARQAAFVQACVEEVSRLHHHNKKITIVAHSMGAVAAWPFVFNNTSVVNRFVVLCAPLQRPTVALKHMDAFYHNNLLVNRSLSSLEEVLVVSIACGRRDVLVPSSLCSLPLPETNKTVELLASSLVGFSIDHQAILWCKQFSTRLANAVSASADDTDFLQALFAGKEEMDLRALKLRLVESEQVKWKSNAAVAAADALVFALRLHWPRLLGAMFAVLCFAAREKRAGWFLPSAVWRLVHTSIVAYVLPFAVLVDKIWVSMWFFCASTAVVSLLLFVSFKMSSSIRFSRRRVQQGLLKLGAVASTVALAVVGLDLAYIVWFAFATVLAAFWLVVDGKRHSVHGMALFLVLVAEIESLLLCLESTSTLWRVGRRQPMSLQEILAVGESLMLFLPWFVLAYLISTYNKSSQAVIVVVEEEEEEQTIESAPLLLPLPAAQKTQGEEIYISIEPSLDNDILEFRSDLQYLDKSKSMLIKTNANEIVQVDDLVCITYVEKDANAVSIISPREPRTEETKQAAVEQEEEEEVAAWPKWTVWVLQVMGLGCMILPDQALPKLGVLGACFAGVLCVAAWTKQQIKKQ